MKEHLIFKILNHLYEKDAINEGTIDITDFLKTIWNERDKVEEFDNLKRINYAISHISNDNYGFFAMDPGHHQLNENKVMGSEVQRCTLLNTAVKARITPKGYDYIVDELRKRQQDELNQNIIATNISLQQVNNSAQDLNVQTKKYYKQLEYATWVIAAATLLNIGATLIPFIFRKSEGDLHHQAQPAFLQKSAGQPHIKTDSLVKIPPPSQLPGHQ